MGAGEQVPERKRVAPPGRVSHTGADMTSSRKAEAYPLRKAEAGGFAGIFGVRSGFARGSLTPYQRTPEIPGTPRDPLGSLGGFTPLGAANPILGNPRPLPQGPCCRGRVPSALSIKSVDGGLYELLL